jgi:hypothetical protein
LANLDQNAQGNAGAQPNPSANMRAGLHFTSHNSYCFTGIVKFKYFCTLFDYPYTHTEYLIIQFVLIISDNATKIAFFDGYLLKTSCALFGNKQNFLVLLGSATLLVFFFDFFSISAQFVYRYLVLNRYFLIYFITKFLY